MPVREKVSIMRCPKCDQKFEEGSRRFCPTDGARLMPENDPPVPAAGIFSTILQRSGQSSRAPQPSTLGVDAGNDTLDPAPIARSVDTSITDPPNNDIFFELNDEDLELELDDPPRPIDPSPVFKTIPVSNAPPRFGTAKIGEPPVRKVDAAQIPAGHIDLNNPGRPQAFPEVDPDAPDRFTGSMVRGRYEITEYLGGDESGFAYVGEDRLGDDRKVLVRIFELSAYDDMVASMIAEERVTLAHFAHPNVARSIDSGEFATGQGFLITEYFDALSVAEILAIHGKLDRARTSRIIRQAASALGEAHQEGILHRDLRPENFILDHTDDGEQLKIVNFGASNGEATETNIYYKSPEVAGGRVSTAASDIYSLSVIAYEMLTGDVPFHGNSLKEFQRAQRDGLDPEHAAASYGLPYAAGRVIARGLAVSPSDRFVRARDLGEALATALTDADLVVTAETPEPRTDIEREMAMAFANGEDADVIIEEVAPSTTPTKPDSEPAWKNRSTEPPQEATSRFITIAVISFVALTVLLVAGWYYLYKNPPSQNSVAPEDQTANINMPTDVSPLTADIEVPPLPRKLPQPPNTLYYQNTKQNLRGDLLRNFVGFTLYYPKDWTVNGPQNGAGGSSRGKFLDISRTDQMGRMKEQMLISYYPSKGTFTEDSANFGELANETNETLKKILPGYEMLGQGETKFNGDWKAYEVRFQGSGTAPSGEKLMVWGRRLFIPAARPGTRNGFEITLLATSLADGIERAEDVGIKGELAPVLFSFEPSQNF
jgi:serine/threonine protein kinase